MRRVVLGVMLGLAMAPCAATAAPAPKPSTNIEAVRAAIDPAQGPTIVEPIYGGGKYPSDPSLGGPGGYWPDRALRLEISGVAVIKCTLAEQGALTGCALLADGPTTFGFGDAALMMAKDGRVKAKPTDGVKVGDPVRVIVLFTDPKKYWGNH